MAICGVWRQVSGSGAEWLAGSGDEPADAKAVFDVWLAMDGGEVVLFAAGFPLEECEVEDADGEHEWRGDGGDGGEHDE